MGAGDGPGTSRSNAPGSGSEAAAAPLLDARRGRAVARIMGSASALLMAAIVLMLNYLALRHYKRFDWTRGGLFTLSDKSDKALSGLTSDVDIYLFLSQGEPSYAEIEELLARYTAASARVRVHRTDPDREPSEFKLLAQRFGFSAAMLETGQTLADVAAVVTSGENQWMVRRDELSDLDFGSLSESSGPKLNVRSEQVFTGAILQVTSGRKTKVCLTSGHGEWSEDAGAGRSLSGVQKALRYDNVEFERIETLGKKTLSEECDAIFVLGPLRAFHAQEAELLADSVRSGHGLLLALDPVIERDRVLETGLEALAEEFGVRIDPTLVLELDTQRLASPSVVEFRVTDYLEHETTRPLAALGGVSFFRLARSVRPSDSGQASVLFRSSSASFGERDVAQVRSAQEPKQDPEDVAGPVPLAVAAQYSRRGDAPRAGRLVVVGDSDWLDASFLDSPVLSNVYLLAAFTGWLTERDALIALPPKKATLGHVAFDQAALSGLLLRAVVLMPLSALLIGVAVWWARRQ